MNWQRKFTTIRLSKSIKRTKEGTKMTLNPFKTYRGLPKSIYVLFFAQIINRFGDFVLPFLTLYLTKKLGYSIQTTGILVTIGTLLIIPGSLAGGKFADHVGRKKTYLIAQTLVAVFILPCAFLDNPVLIISFLFLSTFFNGAVRPPMNAIVADLLPPEERKLGFSLLYLGINIGVASGPIVAGFLFNNYLPLLFIGDAVTSIIAVTLVYINVHETNPDSNAKNIDRKEEKKESGTLLSAITKRPQIIMFLFVCIIYSFVYTQHRFSLQLMLDSTFVNQGAKTFGYLMSINAFTCVSMTVFITSFTKKNKPLTNMAIAALLYAVGFGMIGYIKTFPLFIISTVLWTIGEILVVTNSGVYIANNSPENFRARFSSISGLSWAIGGALGTSLVGKYIDVNGIRSVWPLTGILAIVSGLLMMVLAFITAKKESTCECISTD